MKRYGWPTAGVLLVAIFALVSIITQTADVINLTGKATAGTTVNIVQGLPSNCFFTIHPGHNEVSFYCISTFNDINDTLGTLDYNYILTYRASDSNDPWKAYKTDLPSWVTLDLQYTSRTEGYIINADNAQIYFYEGELRRPTTTQMYAGWNLVGYPTNETKNITEAFIDIDGNYTYIKTHNNSNEGFLVFIPPSTGNLTNGTAYQAYWVNMTTKEGWTLT